MRWWVLCHHSALLFAGKRWRLQAGTVTSAGHASVLKSTVWGHYWLPYIGTICCGCCALWWVCCRFLLVCNVAQGDQLPCISYDNDCLYCLQFIVCSVKSRRGPHKDLLLNPQAMQMELSWQPLSERDRGVTHCVHAAYATVVW